ncbi:MAG: alanine dehydrogenase [Streptosporangiales bacterium]|nr:alanine dehydrogenase [Streptosporangiales bacterium]
MTIGLPRETKQGERRVALEPGAVRTLVDAGHRVFVETGAGAAAGFDDEQYANAGGVIRASAEDVWAADVVVKVKEPQAGEYAYLRPGLTLFAYLHLAAARELTNALVRAGVRAYAFETLTERGTLPLLAPMSEVAGRCAAIVGANYLAGNEGGAGVLLGGTAGVPPGRVTVVGLGVSGAVAARGARGLDAEVVGVDVDMDKLQQAKLSGTVTSTAASSSAQLDELVAVSDLVIGAVLVPGARAPRVLSRDQVASMRPGSVIVDLAIDQGGCVETSRPTSHGDPVFEDENVLHYCVTNVPARYPRTASRALSAALAPRLLRLLADPSDPDIATALNVRDGEIVHPAVAAIHDRNS